MRTYCTLGIIGLAGVANASTVGTFGFTDLNSSYDGQTFHALSLGSFPTGGDVTDYSNGPASSATFESGFIGVQNLADVVFQMDISNVTATTADGTSGRIVIRDEDGDVLSGSFQGVWDFRFGFGFFDGEITTIAYNDVGDGLFTGTDGTGAYATPDGTYIGGISFMMEMSTWFGSAAGGPNTFSDEIAASFGLFGTPTPGGVSLLALGGLVASRRRR